MQVDLTGKTIIVTGGSRGIGKSIVYKLVESRANVVFTYNKSSNEAEDIIKKIKEINYQEICAFQVDVTNSNQVRKFVDEIENRFGEIYGLVNNAGINADKVLFYMDNSDWEDVLNTNLTGTFYITKSVIEKMITNGLGKIINMSSVTGIRGSFGQSNYGATKSGLIGFTKCLAVELAKFNIQVNAIAPGYIQTEMVNKIDDKNKKRLKDLIPSQRFGNPEDVADGVLYLLSSSSNYITGHTLVIDGGLSA